MSARSHARTHVFARKRALSSGRQFRPLAASSQTESNFPSRRGWGRGDGGVGGGREGKGREGRAWEAEYSRPWPRATPAARSVSENGPPPPNWGSPGLVTKAARQARRGGGRSPAEHPAAWQRRPLPVPCGAAFPKRRNRLDLRRRP